jgi:hypothetical protein
LDLQALLPQLVRRAIAWAETISAEAATTGDTLLNAGLVIARLVGVQFPEQIRIVVVMSHECRHTYRYETAGGIAMFLPVNSIVKVGYWNSPFEQDARA